MVSSACSDPNWIWSTFSATRRFDCRMFTLRTAPTSLMLLHRSSVMRFWRIHSLIIAPNCRTKILRSSRGTKISVSHPRRSRRTLVVTSGFRWYKRPKKTDACRSSEVHTVRSDRSQYEDPTPGHTGGRGISDGELPPGDIVTAELDGGDVLLTSDGLSTADFRIVLTLCVGALIRVTVKSVYRRVVHLFRFRRSESGKS